VGLHVRIIERVGTTLHAQRGALLGWVPVCLAVGIGCYFSLLWEPSLTVFIGVVAVAVTCAAAARALPDVLSPFAWGVSLCLVGFVIAGARAHSVAGPVLGWRYYGTVEGRVVNIDRSASDALRLTLDEVRLDSVAPDRTPQRVRISLHDKRGQGITPVPGLRVMTTAHLSPPSGAVEPGGFDFQRHAWFARLGAVGYARVPLMGVAPAAEGHAGLMTFRVRMAASAHIQTVLEGDVGGFAAALTTGDRSGMSQGTLDHLRASNLAHLLAISGLHMGLLTAVVFGALRILLAALPFTALRWPTKGVAAFGALIAATGYLALSGGSVATERAYIMVAVALGALMIGRRAISLRAVAVAATLVLVLRPEALMGPGFQMSFAATTALVAVFGVLRRVDMAWMPKVLRPVFATFVSSAVAGLATAPIAAAHFNAIAQYGLIANLLSVPLMGVLVIPAAVLALVLAPLGLDWMALWVMGLGLRWILGVAQYVALLDGARSYVPGPGPLVVPVLTLGFLALVLWQGRLRWLGLPVMAASFALWHNGARPDVLISDTGKLVGVMTPQGRALSKPKGAAFIARNWLENDGDGGAQWQAAARWVKGDVIHLSGKRALAQFTGCRAGQVVVSSTQVEGANRWACDVYDPRRLRNTGSVALSKQTTGSWQVTTARDLSGNRLWTRWPDTTSDQPLRHRRQYVRINPTKRP